MARKVRAARSVVSFYAWGESARQKGEAISYTKPQPLLPTMAGNWWRYSEADSRRTLRAGGELEARNEVKEADWTPDALTAAARGEEDELKGKLNG